MSSMRYMHAHTTAHWWTGMRAYEKITQLITIYESHCFRVATILVFFFCVYKSGCLGASHSYAGKKKSK